MKLIKRLGGILILILPFLFIYAIWFGVDPFILKLIFSDIILIIAIMAITAAHNYPSKN